METRMRGNLIGVVSCAAVMIAAPVLGMVTTAALLTRAFGAVPSVAPSQKAELLARGISTAMNATAIGIGVSVVALVGLIVFAVRLARERRPPPG